jgi:hypothetical protein
MQYYQRRKLQMNTPMHCKGIPLNFNASSYLPQDNPAFKGSHPEDM